MKKKEPISDLNMKIRLDYDVPNPDDSLELFEDGLREAMNKTAKRFGLRFRKLTVEVGDAEP
tara:strand:- start:622 stop:807 length:186 start_codon:yes stop_codon:yes gene_type:complete